MKAIIWDMDGTITDSEQFWTANPFRMLEHFGVPDPRGKDAPWFQTHYSESIKAYLASPDCKLNMTYEECVNWGKNYVYSHAYSEGTPMKPHARESLEAASALHIPMCLLSATEQQALKYTLFRNNMEQYFSFWLTTANRPLNKHHPELFQQAPDPMAAALGIGLDVEAPKGNMVVDIGGGTAEIAVISLGGIVQQESIKTAGDELTSDIQYYLRQQHNIKVGEITAEKIKIEVGAVIPKLDEEPEPFVVRGPNLMTAHPVEARITYQEIAHCLDKSISKIESSILPVLEQTPPELYSDIVENGIFLSGGGALLRGLAQRFTEKVNIQFHVAEDPLRAVARGTCIALKNAANYSFLMR